MPKKNNDIDNILLELAKNITRVADNKLTNEIKEVYKEEVDYMYNEFQPFTYERRYDNKGFADENNWEMNVDISNNGVSLELTNETEAVNSTERLDKIIEEGIYDWTGAVPKERPVYYRAEQRLKDEQIVENILESELKKFGYKFK